MPYTFIPEQSHAKTYGHNLRVSKKSAVIVCAAIRNKPVKRAKRLLVDLKERKRNLKGKYYSKTVDAILRLVESCEKNAESLGLDAGRLFVHASAHQGLMLRRRRRKAAFGSQLKATNVEIMLIERGRISEERRKDKLKEAVKQAVKEEVQKIRETEGEIVKEEKHLERKLKTDKAVEKEIEKDFEEIEEKGFKEELKELVAKEEEIKERIAEEKAKKKTKGSESK